MTTSNTHSVTKFTAIQTSLNKAFDSKSKTISSQVVKNIKSYLAKKNGKSQ